MKQAVDQQELRIQTSLINDENEYGRERGPRDSDSMDSNSEEDQEREYLALKRKAGTMCEYQYQCQNPELM